MLLKIDTLILTKKFWFIQIRPCQLINCIKRSFQQSGKPDFCHMAKMSITYPDFTHFTTQMPVRVTDLNYGNHLGNDAFVGHMHEARLLMLRHFGLSELNIGDEISLIQGDLAVVYKAEGHLGDDIQFSLAVTDFSNSSFDVYYSAQNLQKDKLLALARTRMVCFDYHAGKTRRVPDSFKALFA